MAPPVRQRYPQEELVGALPPPPGPNMAAQPYEEALVTPPISGPTPQNPPFRRRVLLEELIGAIPLPPLTQGTIASPAEFAPVGQVPAPALLLPQWPASDPTFAPTTKVTASGPAPQAPPTRNPLQIAWPAQDPGPYLNEEQPYQPLDLANLIPAIAAYVPPSAAAGAARFQPLTEERIPWFIVVSISEVIPPYVPPPNPMLNWPLWLAPDPLPQLPPKITAGAPVPQPPPTRNYLPQAELTDWIPPPSQPPTGVILAPPSAPPPSPPPVRRYHPLVELIGLIPPPPQPPTGAISPPPPPSPYTPRSSIIDIVLRSWEAPQWSPQLYARVALEVIPSFGPAAQVLSGRTVLGNTSSRTLLGGPLSQTKI